MHKHFILLTFALCSIFFSLSSAECQTKLQWLGHAAFKITTPKGVVLLVDPWLTNPKNPDKKPLDTLGKVDYLLISHGHFDHVGESVEIAQKTGARLVANFELGTNLVKLKGFPQAQAGFDTLMNIGGTITLAQGEVQISMTPAVHSSGLDTGKEQDALVYGGDPVGFVIKITSGPTIYHTGDTAYFSDMKLLQQMYAPDVALINTGGHFGMEQREAARAAKKIEARIIIPHHFGTFPILAQNNDILRYELKKSAMKVRELSPGEEVAFVGRELR